MTFNLIWKCAMNAVLQNKQGFVLGFFLAVHRENWDIAES